MSCLEVGHNELNCYASGGHVADWCPFCKGNERLIRLWEHDFTLPRHGVDIGQLRLWRGRKLARVVDVRLEEFPTRRYVADLVVDGVMITRACTTVKHYKKV